MDCIPVPSLLTIQRNAGVGVSMDSWAVVLLTTLEMNLMTDPFQYLRGTSGQCHYNQKFFRGFGKTYISSKIVYSHIKSQKIKN